MPVPNNESQNISLDNAQTKAIEETKARLLNLEAEISIATKNLKNLKSDTEKVIREKAHQEELLEKSAEQSKEVETRLAALTATILKESYSLSEIKQEIAKKADILSAMEVEFKRREDSISSKEADLVSRETSVSLREEDVKKSEKLLADKHAKIKAFAETI